MSRMPSECLMYLQCNSCIQAAKIFLHHMNLTLTTKNLKIIKFCNESNYFLSIISVILYKVS